MRVVYYDPKGPRRQAGVRGPSHAWLVSAHSERPWDERFGEFQISEALYWALFHLDVVDALAALPHEGIMDAYEEGILLHAALKDARELLEYHAEHVSGAYDWPCSSTVLQGEPIQYRIRVEESPLRAELLSLTDFLHHGARLGYDVQLWL
jgi:hypothetical protein